MRVLVAAKEVDRRRCVAKEGGHGFTNWRFVRCSVHNLKTYYISKVQVVDERVLTTFSTPLIVKCTHLAYLFPI